MRAPRATARLLLAALVGLGLVACGTGDDSGTPSAEDVFAKAERKALAATSVSITGFITQDGERIDLELTGRADGSNARIVISSASQGRAEILQVDDRSFVKGDAAFYAANGSPDVPPEVTESYVAAPAGQDAGFPTARGLLRQTFGGGAGALANLTTRVEDTTFRGEEAYRATDRLGGGGGSGEIIASARTGLPLKLAATGKQAVSLVFSRWNKVPELDAPPSDEVLAP